MKLPDLFTKSVKLTIKTEAILPWLPMFTLVTLGLLFIGLIVFLHRNFYQTLAQVQQVNLLRSQVTQYRINVPLYEKVMANWQNKKNDLITPADKTINPFTLDRQTVNDEQENNSTTEQTPTNDQVQTPSIQTLP